jgi:hypothetical protein
MSDLRYAGLLGGIFEASDIQRDLGCTADEAFIYQGFAADLREERRLLAEQEYRDADQEIESDNVIRGVQWGKPRNRDMERGGL